MRWFWYCIHCYKQFIDFPFQLNINSSDNCGAGNLVFEIYSSETFLIFKYQRNNMSILLKCVCHTSMEAHVLLALVSRATIS